MNFTRAASLLTATALTMTALTACGGDSEPTPSSSTASPIDRGTDSPSETSSGSESSGSAEVPELPEAATKKTKAGAIAFNKFYQVQTGEALHSGNADFLRTYSGDQCKACTGMIERVQEYADQGITTNKNPNSVHDVKARKRSDAGYRVEVTVNASEYHQVLADGSKGQTAKAITMTIVSDTQWVDGHWQIQDQVRVK